MLHCASITQKQPKSSSQHSQTASLTFLPLDALLEVVAGSIPVLVAVPLLPVPVPVLVPLAEVDESLTTT